MFLLDSFLQEIWPEPHKDLEGMFKCTQCHVLGQKVSNDKCLDLSYGDKVSNGS